MNKNHINILGTKNASFIIYFVHFFIDVIKDKNLLDKLERFFLAKHNLF